MDECGDESSMDSSEAFDTYNDDVELSDVDEQEEKFSLSSNTLSDLESSGEYNSDEDDDNQLTDGSPPPLGEILEENNNDPNNNMEGGEEDQAEGPNPIVEPASPQPGCSKNFNRTDNVLSITSDLHKSAIRLQTFLHNTSYSQIVSVLRERPSFEREIRKLFATSEKKASSKRPHDGDEMCQIENKRITLKMSITPTLNDVKDVLPYPAPEMVREDGLQGDEQAQKLTPPETQGQRDKLHTRTQPIPIDSSDDEDAPLIQLLPKINRPEPLQLPKKSAPKASGQPIGFVTTKHVTPTATHILMDWRDGNGFPEKGNMGSNDVVVYKTASATVVRHGTLKTISTSTTTNPALVKKTQGREFSAAVGSSQGAIVTGRKHFSTSGGQILSQGQDRPRQSPVRPGPIVIDDDVPTEGELVSNGSSTRPISRNNLFRPQPPRVFPRQRPGDVKFPLAATYPPMPPFTPDAQPGPSTGHEFNVAHPTPWPTTDHTWHPEPLQDQLLREFREADRQIDERIKYRQRREAEKRNAQNDVTSPQASATVPPRPDKNSPSLPPQPVPPADDQQSSVPLVNVDEGLDLPLANNSGEYCREIYTKLRAMFPNIKKDYIKRITPTNWAPFAGHDIQFGQIVEQLLANEDSWELEIPNEEPNNSRELAGNARTVDEIYEHLLGIFPEADPTFLRNKAEETHNNDQAFQAFVEQNLKSPSYPTREQYLSKMRITEEQLSYTTNFTVSSFIEKFPDPFKHFMDKKRKCKHETVGFEFLKGQFNRLRVSTVSKVYNEAQWNISIAAARLKKIGTDMTSTRKTSEIPTEDINMLQEMAFIRHQNELKKYIHDTKQAEKAAFAKLKKSNELLECQCCYDNECMPSKCSTCDQGHIFCNSCIIKGTDTRLGEGDTHVPCFQDCGSEFSLATLQGILKPTKFSILVKKRQAAEVAAAGLEGLVSCPFCHFASIPPEGDKVFKCLNPECMKESCIQCKEPNHVPLRCNEVGKADKARKYIEEKMTEALARKCYNCKKAYFKEEGCNKISCPCGAIMCYLCDKKIQDYSHFRGQGCDDMTKCPLYSDNARLNAETVRRVADEAKKELLRQDPSLNIETDHLLPTVPPPSAGPHQQIIQQPHVHVGEAQPVPLPHRVRIVHVHRQRLHLPAPLARNIYDHQ